MIGYGMWGTGAKKNKVENSFCLPLGFSHRGWGRKDDGVLYGLEFTDLVTCHCLTNSAGSGDLITRVSAASGDNADLECSFSGPMLNTAATCFHQTFPLTPG